MGGIQVVKLVHSGGTSWAVHVGQYGKVRVDARAQRMGLSCTAPALQPLRVRREHHGHAGTCRHMPAAHKAGRGSLAGDGWVQGLHGPQLSQLVQEGNHLRGGVGRASRNGVCRKKGGLGGKWGGHTHQSVTSLQLCLLYVCTPRSDPHTHLKNAHTHTLLATISPPVWSSRP